MKWTVIIYDWLPPTANRLFRGKLRRRMHLEKESRSFFAVYCELFEVPRATGKRRVTVRVESAARRLADPDAYLKASHDGLVACGRLVDDSSRYLEIGTPAVERGPRLKVEILLEELS